MNIDGDLTITTGTYTCGTTTNLTGSLSNAGTFTGAVGRTLNFIGATNATVTGAGTFLIYNIGLNKSTKATTVEIQSSASQVLTRRRLTTLPSQVEPGEITMQHH